MVNWDRLDFKKRSRCITKDCFFGRKIGRFELEFKEKQDEVFVETGTSFFWGSLLKNVLVLIYRFEEIENNELELKIITV